MLRLRDTVDGVKKSDEDGTLIHSGNNAQESNSDSYEAPSDLPAQAFAKALYPFKGMYHQPKMTMDDYLVKSY